MDLIKEELIKIILDNAIILNENEIKSDTNLIYDLLYDSISVLSLIIEIENKFNIEFDNNSLVIENIDTLDKLYKIVLKKVSEKQN